MRQETTDNLNKPHRPAVAWALTGAGHFLHETVEMIGAFRECAQIDAFLSRGAAEVLAMYRLRDALDAAAASVVCEGNYSFPETGKFAAGRYDAIVIAPATGNTVAKCVLGIADSLVSSIFAQGGKSRVPLCVLPTDVAPEMESVAPNGNRVMVYPREVDLCLTDRLGAVAGVALVRDPVALRRWISDILERTRPL